MKDSQKRITQADYIREGIKFESYIRESDVRLRSDEYIVIHLDGVKFTGNYYKKYSNDDKKQVVRALANVAKLLCDKFSSARISYVYGDEISIILDGVDIKTNYHNRIQKLCSCISSQTTILFFNELQKLNKTQFSDLMQNCVFACKVYNLPKELIDPYMKWRLHACGKMIHDRHEQWNNKKNWEKFGFLITKEDDWSIRSVDFSSKKFQKKPQNEFFNID
ncbi:MAG: hypothetical protein IKA85_03750 [Clostridia bacterium]|nr:hypothetical protein [Clostridia bacterium]